MDGRVKYKGTGPTLELINLDVYFPLLFVRELVVLMPSLLYLDLANESPVKLR